MYPSVTTRDIVDERICYSRARLPLSSYNAKVGMSYSLDQDGLVACVVSDARMKGRQLSAACIL